MEGALVVVSVDDSGVGIEPAAMSGIFDAFAQERRSRAQTFGGLGLGLTISRSLTGLHGGRIEASSDGAGLGSSFRVRLPTVSGPDDDSLLSPRAAHRRRTSARLKILLVEDHGDTAETMATMLRLAGHEVPTAGDVASALQEFERSTPDLVISDLGLPDRSGTDLVRDLRERHPSLRAIALSGYGQESDVDSSREAGFRAHLVKPVDPERLLATIDEVTAAAEA
jgi:CheY-like chemotaxis protein